MVMMPPPLAAPPAFVLVLWFCGAFASAQHLLEVRYSPEPAHVSAAVSLTVTGLGLQPKRDRAKLVLSPDLCSATGAGLPLEFATTSPNSTNTTVAPPPSGAVLTGNTTASPGRYRLCYWSDRWQWEVSAEEVIVKRDTDHCVLWANCSACAADRECGWCNATRRCVRGSLFGPMYAEDSCFAYLYGACQLWSPYRVAHAALTAALSVAGLAGCLSGYYFPRGSVAFAVALAVGGAVYHYLTDYVPGLAQGFGLITGLCAALVAVALVRKFHRWVRWSLLASCAGWLFALCVLSALPSRSLGTAEWAFIAIAMGAAILNILVFTRGSFILFTAFGGAYLFTIGVDHLLGLNIVHPALLHNRLHTVSEPSHSSAVFGIMMALTAVLTVLGSVIQRKLVGKRVMHEQPPPPARHIDDLELVISSELPRRPRGYTLAQGQGPAATAVAPERRGLLQPKRGKPPEPEQQQSPPPPARAAPDQAGEPQHSGNRGKAKPRQGKGKKGGHRPPPHTEEEALEQLQGSLAAPVPVPQEDETAAGERGYDI